MAVWWKGLSRRQKQRLQAWACAAILYVVALWAVTSTGRDVIMLAGIPFAGFIGWMIGLGSLRLNRRLFGRTFMSRETRTSTFTFLWPIASTMGFVTGSVLAGTLPLSARGVLAVWCLLLLASACLGTAFSPDLPPEGDPHWSS